MDPTTIVGITLLGGISYGAYSYLRSMWNDAEADQPVEIEMQEWPKDVDRQRLNHPTRTRPQRRGVRPPSRK